MTTYTKEIWVDAGIVMIGDPCYSWPNGSESRQKLGHGDWGSFCDKLSESDLTQGGPGPTIAEPFGEGLGTVVSSGLGDGCYKLTIETVDVGDWGERVSRITLDFGLKDESQSENLDDSSEEGEG